MSFSPGDVHRFNEKHRPEYCIPNINGVIIIRTT